MILWNSIAIYHFCFNIFYLAINNISNAKFSKAISSVFSVTWSFRSHCIVKKKKKKLNIESSCAQIFVRMLFLKFKCCYFDLCSKKVNCYIECLLSLLISFNAFSLKKLADPKLLNGVVCICLYLNMKMFPNRSLVSSALWQWRWELAQTWDLDTSITDIQSKLFICVQFHLFLVTLVKTAF